MYLGATTTKRYNPQKGRDEHGKTAQSYAKAQRRGISRREEDRI